MARKIDPHAKPGQAPTDAAAENAGDDLSILHPDQALTIAGRAVTVREYRFIDGLRVRARAKTLIADLEGLVRDGDAEHAGIEDYVDLLATHHELVLDLMAESIEGADRDWIEGLDAEDGHTLLLAWWGVCGGFFVRVVAGRLRDRLLVAARHESDGPTSSTSSATPDTAAPIDSPAASPSVN